MTLDIDLRPEAGEVTVEVLDLLLQRREMRRHVLELAGPKSVALLLLAKPREDILGFLEIIAAVWRILAVEVEVAAALTRCLAVAFDLAPLAFVAVYA
jgi:hypothetical protein